VAGEWCVILVHSTAHALRAEKLLSLVGIPSKLIPVPRHLSSDCGVCVRVASTDAQAAELALTSNRAPFASLEPV
jgi:hypothetical protein